MKVEEITRYEILGQGQKYKVVQSKGVPGLSSLIHISGD